MALVSARLRSTDCGYAHWCPGCGEMHVIYVAKASASGARWAFDGDLIRPTFTPSVRIEWAGGWGEQRVPRVCHYFLREGRMQFLGDTTHSLRNRTVVLPDLPVVG